MPEYLLTITVDAPPEVDKDDILDSFPGEIIDVGDYSVEVIRGRSIRELPEGGAYE